MAEIAKLASGGPDPQPDDLERFGELVAEQLLEIRKAIPVAPTEVLPPVVNLTTPPPLVTVNPVINLTTDSVNVGFDIATIVAAIEEGSATGKSSGELIAKAIYDGMKLQADATLAQAKAIEAQTAALLAPRELTMDANGKPIGVVIVRR